MDINVCGKTANISPNKLYRGIGMISANNSSRLLLDYKSENSDKYWDILNLLFGEEHMTISHLKIEMGSDINSTSGTEPCIMRTLDEEPDITRGMGFQLAADAQKVNKNLALDMLWWSEPTWVEKSEDHYDARYKWYKAHLESAFSTYGIKFDYVSANQNERQIDASWIKYLSKRLKSENSSSYDFSTIKIVAADEEASWTISLLMLDDDELRKAVDIVGSHYSSHSDENTKKLSNAFNKDIWFSEASPPMSYSKGVHRVNETGSSLSGLNGFLDIANRLIAMYPQGDMVLHQFQPAVASYYDGVTFSHKQLINACDPWSGFYTLDSGFFLTLHFSRFIKKGWSFVESACACDGEKGGDGHAIVNATHSYMTLCDQNSGDYSLVIANSTERPITYKLRISNIKKAGQKLNVWESRGSVLGECENSYLVHTQTIKPKLEGDEYVADITLSPYSIVTLTTLEVQMCDYQKFQNEERTVLPLPYEDDFEYSEYPITYLCSRGFTPRYTTDEGGAFEVVNDGNRNVLRQKITPQTLAKEWGKTPEPTTNFGDDRWFNYSVQVDVRFDNNPQLDENYVGVGLRYNLGDRGTSGYWLQLFDNGKWLLNRNEKSVAEGVVILLRKNEWETLRIDALHNEIKAYYNNDLIIDYTEKDAVVGAGRGSLFSAYAQNDFNNLSVNPLSETYSIKRYDNTDELVSYIGKWNHNTMSSFKHYHRTFSQGEAKAKIIFTITGSGFAVIGNADYGCALRVEINGVVVEPNYRIPQTDFREISYSNFDLDYKCHTVEITVLNGILGVDAIEVLE